MFRVWCLVCFVVGSSLGDSGVPQVDLEDGTPVTKDGAPAMMLVRMKRSPARTMTLSGYMPNGGLSYASTDLMFPYSSMGYASGMDMWPYPPHPHPQMPSKDLEPPSRSDLYGPDEGGPPLMETDPMWPEKDPGVNNGMTTWSAPKKNKKKQWFQKVSPPTTADEDAEEGDFDKSDGSARAQASFNAWFPIMLGVFPYGQGGGAPGEAARGGYPSSSSSQEPSSYGPPSQGSPQRIPSQGGSHGSPSYGGSQGSPSQGGSHGSPTHGGSHGSPSHGTSPGSPSHGSPSPGPGSHGPAGSRPSNTQSSPHRYYTTTVIANSVNNGKSGIASSTATAYGSHGPQ